MPNLFYLLTSFRGRINRLPFWIGFVLVASVSFAGTLVIQPGYFSLDNPQPVSLSLAIWQLVWLWPMAAITIKRCNDLGWPSIIGYGYCLLLLPVYGLPLLGSDLSQTPWIVPYALLIGFYSLIMLVYNGFFQSNPGPNQHGEDPLGRPAIVET